MATPQILDTNDYDEIRDRLGSISADVLTDDIIEKTSYLQRAEAVVRAKVSNWEAIKTADGDEYIYLKVAVIALTAYYLVPKVQQLVKSENIIDYSYSAYSVDDWRKFKADLLGEASLSSILEVPAPFFHTLAGPTRRRNDAIPPLEC